MSIDGGQVVGGWRRSQSPEVSRRSFYVYEMRVLCARYKAREYARKWDARNPVICQCTGSRCSAAALSTTSNIRCTSCVKAVKVSALSRKQRSFGVGRYKPGPPAPLQPRRPSSSRCALHRRHTSAFNRGRLLKHSKCNRWPVAAAMRNDDS